MEILKINDCKMKISLDKADMRNYLVSTESLNYSDPASRKKIRLILDEVKERCGFDISGERTLIQCYPCRDGGCEMFVTKLGSRSPVDENIVAKSGKVAWLSPGKSVYFFENLEQLCFAVRKLAPLVTAESCDVFLCDNGTYLLTVEECRYLDGKDGGKMPPSSFAFSEFSLSYTANLKKEGLLYSSYISEHAKKLTAGDALHLFAKL